MIAVLGVLFVGILVFLRKKKFVVILGIVLILIYFVVASSVFLKCILDADDMSFLKRYEGKKITLCVGDEIFEWNGEAFFGKTRDFEVIKLDGQENYCKINGEKQSIYYARRKPGDPDSVYCQMHGISDYQGLVLVRR